MISRDDDRCQKCYSPSDLEVHHKLERAFGGGDDAENLVTLCGSCHAEWSFCEPNGCVPFDRWLLLPPARDLVLAFSFSWPADMTAAAFQERLGIELARAIDARNKREREKRR